MRYGGICEDMEETRIDQIAQFYASQYHQELEGNKFPNLGLIIRDALIEYRKQTTGD